MKRLGSALSLVAGEFGPKATKNAELALQFKITNEFRLLGQARSTYGPYVLGESELSAASKNKVGDPHI